jgi:hypothetical protein
MNTAQWSVEISCRTDQPTHMSDADAVLTAGLDHLTGHGIAIKNPADPDLPAVGAEIAVARALDDLAGQLRTLAETEIKTWAPADGTIRLPNPARLSDPYAEVTEPSNQ